jgi:hypothetical protein
MARRSRLRGALARGRDRGRVRVDRHDRERAAGDPHGALRGGPRGAPRRLQAR